MANGTNGCTWTNNNLACLHVWSWLRYLEQFRWSFKSAGNHCLNEMTYWNAFTGDDTDWAAMHRVQNEEIAMVVLFPEDKPLKKHTFLQYEKGAQPESFRGRHKSYVSENGLVLFWAPEELKRDLVYQVKWHW